MHPLKQTLADPRIHRLAGFGVLLMTGAALVAWKMGVDAGVLKSWWSEIEHQLKLHPVWLFLAIVVLPGFPVPASALMFLAGTVWGDRPVLACAISLSGIALNMTWTYWVAARPGRGLVERYFSNSSVRMPQLPKGNHLQVVLLTRLTPGLPLFFQNYLLGFLRVPFGLYLSLSICCNGLIAIGVVLSGAGVADGNLKPMISGVALIGLGFVVVRMLRQKLRG